MKTFLETNREDSRTFLLYGGTNDPIYCGDLTVRSSEQFLVRYLKSRGYRHIVFFGDSANKGAYCLDPESARFFFAENKDLPPAKLPDRPQDAACQPEQDAACQPVTNAPRPTNMAAGKPKGRLAGMVKRYRPGDIPPAKKEAAEQSESGGKETVPGQSAQQKSAGKGTVQEEDAKRESAGKGTVPEEKASSAPAAVRYALRNLTLNNFITYITPLMLDPESRMAIVFYNIFASALGSAAPLRDDILTIWEQSRWSRNICLLMAPGTMYSLESVVNCLHTMELDSKFLITVNGNVSLNPRNCFSFGLPQEDEIRNLLRRLRILGTEERGRKICYGNLPELSAEILGCSRGCDAREDGQRLRHTAEYMRQIAWRVQSYVDAQPGTEPVELTAEVIDGIWNRPVWDRTPALEKLKRPGWEAAYQTVSAAVGACTAWQKRHGGDGKPPVEAPDIAVRRLSTAPPPEAPRPPVPNFVLLGNPGVGKTTIARLIGRVLREHGVLRTGATLEVTQSALTSSYVAGTPRATMDCVSRAEEGVLFIDEAHTLGYRDGGANHEGTGKEVISALNNALTDPNRHFCLILAGYETKMEAVFEADPGFRSRFGGNFIVIQDYKPELLEKILTEAIEKAGCRLDPALTEERQFDETAARPLSCYLRRLYQERSREEFGNAREMEALAGKVCGAARGNVVTEDCFYREGVDHEWFCPSDVGCSKERILKELRERFAGMEWAEAFIEEKAQEVEEKLAWGGSEEDVRLRPLILVGESGMGKTSFVRLLARFYYHFHLTGSAEPIEVSANELAGSYAGGTQEKTGALIRKAQERKALLFVDEAHGLCNPHFDGAGALKSFLNPLTDRQRPFLAVFAVYPKHLEEFLKLDPGTNRFDVIEMEPYKGPVLFRILHMMMEKHLPPLTAREDTDALLRRVCDYKYAVRDEAGGNARGMENLLEEMNKRRRKRCARDGIGIRSPEGCQFLPEDVPEALAAALPRTDASPEEILAELDELCGLEEVKADVRQMLAQVQLARIRKAQGLKTETSSLHMVFQGNPGTGKTVVARLIGRLYRSIGVLPKGHLVETDRAGLVAGYVGQTALKTQEVLQKAMGGVLFIDEAYTLSGGGNDFGQEAIDTILKSMEDHSSELVVIAAGYPDRMERFLQSNPGLESRFPKRFRFRDYSLEELGEILDLLCRKRDYVMTPEARGLAMEAIERGRGKGRDFGNGRFVRNLLEKLIANQALRVVGLTEHTRETLTQITPEDFQGLE